MATATQRAPPHTAAPAPPPELNKAMAVQCVEHAETYWKILERVPGSKVQLTRADDDLYTDFLAAFPEFAPAAQGPDPVSRISEAQAKHPDAQPRWQALAAKYEGKIASPHQGTLIRNNAADEYTQFNTMFVIRLQFYCFEIARNRRGLNDWIHANEQKKRESAKSG